MVQSCQARFNASFGALSDVTRRGVLVQARFVTTDKVGRVRTCKLGPSGLQERAAWIERYRQLCGARFDELDNVVEQLKPKENVDGRKNGK